MPKTDGKAVVFPSQLHDNITKAAQGMRDTSVGVQWIRERYPRASCQAASSASWSSGWAIEINSSARSLRVFP